MAERVLINKQAAAQKERRRTGRTGAGIKDEHKNTSTHTHISSHKIGELMTARVFCSVK